MRNGWEFACPWQVKTGSTSATVEEVVCLAGGADNIVPLIPREDGPLRDSFGFRESLSGLQALCWRFSMTPFQEAHDGSWVPRRCSYIELEPSAVYPFSEATLANGDGPVRRNVHLLKQKADTYAEWMRRLQHRKDTGCLWTHSHG